MIYLILWFVCGFICSVIAGAKGRNSSGFFIIGLLLGPLGIVLCVFISKNTEVIEKEKLTTGEMKKCPMCAELIKREAIKCRYCGSDLSKIADKPIKTIESLDGKSTSILQSIISGRNSNDMVGLCSCGRRFTYPVADIGKTESCPGCKKEFTLT